ncbi:MAG: tRNA (5-methylaminomethyl-2-thiouridine)(34)-methyltransferase MnmD [Flavobacteriales bacterium]|nr:tRNA (5-methylaminomethyl-2-thiouridine)(34)-methyltransferase MnmD [Flavobacteriales bacterium]
MQPYQPPGDFVPLTTADGSRTLRSARLGEQYHSVHGAVQESRHVFITMGLKAFQKQQVDVLEVGLGTGLNMLLTWQEAEASDLRVTYTALEPYPPTLEEVMALDHPAAIGAPERAEGFHRAMAETAGELVGLSQAFRFQRLATPVQELQRTDAFDLVYFDAFGPEAQPEMWTAEVFTGLFRAMRPGALLVTYCAKGVVRRTLLSAGFHVERLPGPPGKREMLRACRP